MVEQGHYVEVEVYTFPGPDSCFMFLYMWLFRGPTTVNEKNLILFVSLSDKLKSPKAIFKQYVRTPKRSLIA